MRVAAYWNDVGRVAVTEMVNQGKYGDLENREQILKKLIELHGDGSAESVRQFLLREVHRAQFANPADRKVENQLKVESAKKTFEALGVDFARQLVLERAF